MKTVEFLSYIRSLDIKLWLEGERLRYSAPARTLTPDLLSQLAERKLEIIAFLRQAEATAQTAAAQPILPCSREQQIPLSHAQERLWIINHLNPDNAAYNISIAVRLEGSLKFEALYRSFEEIIRRHETLRTAFPEISGQPFQSILPAAELQIPFIDLRMYPQAEREAEFQRLAAEDAQRPFDLSQAPLLRASILKLDEEEHILLLVMHHIVSDGWSIGILIREMAALYEAFSDGRTSPLPQLPVQYADYSIWQRRWLTKNGLNNQLGYWEKQLSGDLPVLELYPDRPRPAMQTFRGATLRTVLPKTLTADLNALCLHENVTLFMLLLAAFKVLLSRYTGQKDILIGTPIANRHHRETENLIGFFVNTLVLRTDLSADPQFPELLRRIHETALGAYANQDVPFEMLVGKLESQRGMNRTPLFQAMLVLQNAPMPTLKVPGLTLSSLLVENRTAKFDLTLNMEESEDGLITQLEYNADLFDGETIIRMLEHFEVLLRGIVENPNRSISALPLLTESERRKLTEEWNQTGRDFPASACLHELFEAQAERTPDAIAILFNEKSLSYRELNAEANKLARHLRRHRHAGPERLVGLYLERSPEMVIAILAVLKAGAAYLPLDTSAPPQRLSLILGDADVSALITEQRLAANLSARLDESKVVALDTVAASVAAESQHNLQTVMAPENLAYVIYTSGSTGTPKGTLVSHYNVVRLFQSTQALFSFNRDDVWTLFHSYAFDFSVWELWGALLYGGRLIVVPYLVTRSPEAFYQLLCQQGVTVLNQTPSAFRQLMKAEEALGAEAAAGLRLRQVIFGGEALELQSLWRWFESHAEERPQLVNMYGITETTVHVTYKLLSASVLNTARGNSIGSPLPDLQVYLLDEQMQLVPIGVVGEIYVGGAGLARGYLHRAGLMAERYVPHPFAKEGGKRLYRSGDLARYRPDGELEYIGRIDHQVKVRGFRIELGEIEAALNQHGTVQESVVLLREDMFSGKQLVAYVVPHHGQTPTIDELRGALKEKLPDYMIPASFVMLDSLPLTSNGKVNSKALPEPDTTRPTLENSYVAPRTPVEEALASIWAEVLRLERIGIHDNFFDLGGDSIRAIQVHAKARQAGIGFSTTQLFRFQTISDLAQEATSTSEKYLPAIEKQAFSLISEDDRVRLPAGLEDAYPLTMLQLGMIYHSHYSLDTPAYHNASSFHLQSPFDLQKLKAALEQLASRHPILRTSFDLTAFSVPLQLVHKIVEIPLQVEDIRQFSSPEQEQYINTWFEAEGSRQFDLTRPPLIRFQVHLRSERTFQLSWAEHHAILDGWSIASLLTEMFQIYFSLMDEAAPVSDAPAVQFRDYVALEKDALEAEECRGFWKEKLRGATATLVSRWPSRQAHGIGGQTAINVPIPAEVSDGLRRLATSLSVPLKYLLLAAHLRVLSFISGQSDVSTGVVYNGRPEDGDGERVLGMFLNTLPFRLKINGGTWADLARQTFEIEQEILPFRRYPLAELQRTNGNVALFETNFNYTHFHAFENLKSLSALKVLSGKEFGDTNYPFTVDFSIDLATSNVGLTIAYFSSEFCDEQIKRISGYYTAALTAMAHHPSSLYDAHSLLSSQEREQLLVEWNSTSPLPLPSPFIHRLFEEQAALTPEAVAILCDGFSLSYSLLNSKANQLAHHLLSLRLSPEQPVALCLHRSPRMVIALLAVLKAGGAYLPLDPAYPPARLTFMAADAGARLLITEQELAATIPAGDYRLVVLDGEDAAVIEQQERTTPHGTARGAAIGGEQLAYIIYTSGSTGQPKGVLVSHAAITRHCLTIRHEFALRPSDRILQFASSSFDVSIEEMMAPLISGGAVVLRGRELWSVQETHAQLRRAGVTVGSFSPAYWQQMVEQWDESDAEELAQLRLITVGGDELRAEVLQRWPQTPMRRAEVWNAYGPTEATITVSFYRMRAGEVATALEGRRRVPIGKGVGGRRLHILDERGALAPVGVAGELHIGGWGLSRGYMREGGRTAEKFVPDEYSEEGGGRLYKTGDLARRLADGEIEYLGRIDHQVKIRGFRIELGEIEAAVREQAGVCDAVVIARSDGHEEKHLVAYVVVEAEATVGVAQLRGQLRERLPEYMVPSAVVMLEEFPLTPSGKLDREALPEPDAAESEPEREFVGARDINELQLTEIWEDVLRVQPISVRDNFFELGGHSIMAVRLMARIQQQFGLPLSLATLIEGATIEQLAAHLRQETGLAYQSSLVKIRSGGLRAPFFCIHPAGGNVLCYADLARYLGSDQPFYGLQAQGLNGVEPTLVSIENMAARYLDDVRRIQPQGPYLLGGWSMGGTVAFEMARQLQSLGQSIALLALFDTRPYVEDKAAAETDDVALLGGGFAQDMGLSFDDLSISQDELLRLRPDEQLAYLLQEAKKANIVPPDIELRQVQQIFEVFKTNVRALRGYVPQTYAGRVTLFKAAAQEKPFPDEVLMAAPNVNLQQRLPPSSSSHIGSQASRVEASQLESSLSIGDSSQGSLAEWSRLATEGVETYTVPGTHLTMIREPHVRTLAAQLKSVITKALPDNGLR